MSNQVTIDLDEVLAVHSGQVPLYHSVGHVIRSKIQSGEWQPGAQIPSERALMEMFGVSRATIRQGIENLVKEGVLTRLHGKGTFVAPPKISQGSLRLLEFETVMRDSGLNPSADLLARQSVEAPLDVRKVLGLPEASQAIWMQRLLRVNRSPMLIETAYFSADRFPALLTTYQAAEAPLVFVCRHYGVRLLRESEALEPVILESSEAGVLGVKSGFPALWVEHVVFDAGKTPVAYITNLIRGDRCRFYSELTLG